MNIEKLAKSVTLWKLEKTTHYDHLSLSSKR